MSNARFRWFEYKLRRKLGVVDLRALRLEEPINKLNIEVELQKEEMAWIEDKAMDWGIDASFKIFRQLLLELYPNFNIRAFKASMSKEVIEKVLDEVERKDGRLRNRWSKWRWRCSQVWGIGWGRRGS